jgi:hypothetical protein
MVLGSVERALERALGHVDHVPDGLELRSDHGPQYTGSDAADLARRWRLNHTFAPVGRPTGKAVAERTIQTMKLECLWLADFEDQAAVQAALNQWAHAFNHDRPHQALKWKTPAEFRAEKLGPAPQQAADTTRAAKLRFKRRSPLPDNPAEQAGLFFVGHAGVGEGVRRTDGCPQFVQVDHPRQYEMVYLDGATLRT